MIRINTLTEWEAIRRRRPLSIYENMLYTQSLITQDPDRGQIRLRFHKWDGILWDDHPEDRADDDLEDEIQGTHDRIAKLALDQRERIREARARRT